MRVLGIDLGTTTIKGAVLDLDSGTVGKMHTRASAVDEPTEIFGRRESSVEFIVGTVGLVLDALLEEAPDAGHLFLCGQMHGITVIDAEGMLLTPFISWKDQRGLEPYGLSGGTYLDHFGGLMTDEERALTGNELRTGQGALTMACLEGQGELPDKAMAVPVCDAVMTLWTGQPPILHPTFAASLGVYDIANQRWASGLIEKWKLSRFTWPEVTREKQPVYELHRKGRTLAVYPALGDHQAALMGSNLAENELSINMATGSQIAALSREFKPGSYQTRPFPNGGYLNAYPDLPAGRALTRLARVLLEIPRGESKSPPDPWEYIFRSAAEVATTPVSMDLSFFECPTGSEGHIKGLTEETFRVGHLFRAALVCMAQNYYTFAGKLDASLPWQTIVLSGGLAQEFSLIRGEIKRVFQRPIEEREEEEETLLGLLKWGRQCLGMDDAPGQ